MAQFPPPTCPFCIPARNIPPGNCEICDPNNEWGRRKAIGNGGSSRPRGSSSSERIKITIEYEKSVHRSGSHKGSSGDSTAKMIDKLGDTLEKLVLPDSSKASTRSHASQRGPSSSKHEPLRSKAIETSKCRDRSSSCADSRGGTNARDRTATWVDSMRGDTTVKGHASTKPPSSRLRNEVKFDESHHHSSKPSTSKYESRRDESHYPGQPSSLGREKSRFESVREDSRYTSKPNSSRYESHRDENHSSRPRSNTTHRDSRTHYSTRGGTRTDDKTARGRSDLSMINEETPDYYKILGVSPRASADEIKTAAKKARVETHPDKLVKPDMSTKEIDSIHKRAIQVGEAADVLTDPKLKREYDESY
ncbi:DnaJ molecular chaperone y domain [Lecanora helva]